MSVICSTSRALSTRPAAVQHQRPSRFRVVAVRASAEPTSDRRYIAPTENPIGWTINENYGIGKGNTISFALPKPVELPLKEDGTRMTYEELLDSTAPTRAALQLQAAQNLTNISAAERERRGKAGAVLLVVAAAAAAAAVALHLDPGARAAAVGLPFWLGYSLRESQKQGICSIAQAGAWDVDGCGLSYIEDESLAAKIRSKVNNMYVQHTERRCRRRGRGRVCAAAAAVRLVAACLRSSTGKRCPVFLYFV